MHATIRYVFSNDIRCRIQTQNCTLFHTICTELYHILLHVHDQETELNV